MIHRYSYIKLRDEDENTQIKLAAKTDNKANDIMARSNPYYVYRGEQDKKKGENHPIKNAITSGVGNALVSGALTKGIMNAGAHIVKNRNKKSLNILKRLKDKKEAARLIRDSKGVALGSALISGALGAYGGLKAYQAGRGSVKRKSVKTK